MGRGAGGPVVKVPPEVTTAEYRRVHKRLDCGGCAFADKAAVLEARVCCCHPGVKRVTGEGMCLNRMRPGEDWREREARRKLAAAGRLMQVGRALRRLEQEALMLQRFAR